MLSISLFAAVLLLCSFDSGWTKKKECYVDENGDKDDPNNIYTCKNEEKCCHEDAKPSCCKEKELKVAATEQAKVWGALAGIIILIAVFMFCCRNDGDCCWDRKDGGRYKYCCCGPVIYREGKGPNANEKPDYQKLNEDHYPYKDAEHDPSLRRPEGAPPPYQESEIKNINETAPNNVRKNSEHNRENPQEHKETPRDHENGHKRPSSPQPNRDNDPHVSDQLKSHQPSNEDHNQDKPQADLMSFTNDEKHF